MPYENVDKQCFVRLSLYKECVRGGGGDVAKAVSGEERRNGSSRRACRLNRLLTTG